MEIVIIGILVMLIFINGLIYTGYKKQYEQLERIIELTKDQNTSNQMVREQLYKIEENTQETPEIPKN